MAAAATGPARPGAVVPAWRRLYLRRAAHPSGNHRAAGQTARHRRLRTRLPAGAGTYLYRRAGGYTGRLALVARPRPSPRPHLAGRRLRRRRAGADADAGNATG